jgi:hypothetical protein
MQAPGPEYILMLNDRHLRESLPRKQSRALSKQRSTASPPPLRRSWLRHIWLKLGAPARILTHEPAQEMSEPRIGARPAALFGSAE